MPDLTTRYLGLQLRCPLVASAGPLTDNIDSLKRLEDEGIGAVVLPSLFQEQLEHEELELHRLQEYGSESFAEALDYVPDLDDYNTGPDAYLRLIQKAREQLNVPVIASLNGCSQSGWVRFAKEMESAGANALELNVYFIPTDWNQTGAEVEQQYLDLIASVSSNVQIPVAVKFGAVFSSLPNMAQRMLQAGASGLVLFNRYLHPDLDIEQLQVAPCLELSRPAELRMSVQWIAILSGQVNGSLALTSGVHTGRDLVKAVMAGADVAMVTSALLQNGHRQVAAILDELRDWMSEHHYESVNQMRGCMNLVNSPDPTAYQRGNYMRALTSYSGERTP